MKKYSTIAIVFTVIIFPIYTQPLLNAGSEKVESSLNASNYLTHLLWNDPTFDTSDFEAATREIGALFNKFSAHSKDTLRLVYKIYSHIQRKELRHYETQVNFSETLLNKNYDCLTGSLLIALVLDRLEIPFQVMEFNYHIALKLTIEGKPLMIDATDPIAGFIDNEKEINERVSYYTSNQNVSLSENFVEVSQYDELKLVGLQELVALHYFNLAVNYFNSQQMNMAFELASNAYQLYPSERHLRMLQLIDGNSQLLASY